MASSSWASMWLSFVHRCSTRMFGACIYSLPFIAKVASWVHMDLLHEANLHSAKPFDLIHSDIWDHNLRQRVAINVMSFLLMIIPAIHGFTSWSIALSCVLFMIPLFTWFTHSVLLQFEFFALTGWWVFVWCFLTIFVLKGYSCLALLSWRSCSEWCRWTKTSPSYRNGAHTYALIFYSFSFGGFTCFYCCLSHQ